LQAILAKKDENISSLKGALDSANTVVEKLRVENASLVEDLQEQERQIRIEVSEEIEERFKATRARSLEELERLQSKLASDSSLCRSTRKAQMDKADVRIHELMDQVGECEEEMIRLRKEHAAEKMHLQSRIRVLEVMKKTVRFDDQTMDRISTLEKDLESSKKQVENLKKSKEELIETYEKLLHDNDEEDEERTANSRLDEEDSSILENKAPTFGLKHTSRRPLQAINRANTRESSTKHTTTKRAHHQGRMGETSPVR
jgi:chromosome segregation ATPase